MIQCAQDQIIRPAGYNLFGDEHELPWDKEGRLHWHMANFSTDIPKHLQIQLLSDAFQEINKWIYPLQVVQTTDFKKADWKIYVVDEENMVVTEQGRFASPFDFEASPSTIALQYSYYPGFENSLTMYINDRFRFGLEHADGVTEIRKVLAHEILHGLHIGHTDAPGDLMLPVYDPNNEITQDTVNGLWDAHGYDIMSYSRKLPQSIRYRRNVLLQAGRDPDDPSKEWMRPVAITPSKRNYTLIAIIASVVILIIILLLLL